MRLTKHHFVRSLYLGGLLGAYFGTAAVAPSFAQEKKSSADAPAPIRPASTTGTIGRSLQYNPPVRGNPTGRVGGGTRSGNQGPSVVLDVLTPEHTGLTTKEQPTLYWYLSQPTNYMIELTLIESKVAKPLLETKITSPTQGGIQKIRLADHNVRLKTGTEYRWYVALVPDPKNRSKDILAGGFIERVELSEPLRARLTQANAASVYAEEGIWYDALAAVSDAIDGGNNNLRAQRASLLEQVKLQQVAEFDRGAVR